MNLQIPIAQLGKIGKQLEKKLKNLGIKTIQDLLFYFPYRYEDYSQAKLIKDLEPGEQITIRAKVELIQTKRSWQKRRLITEAVVADESGRLKIIWFGQPFITKVLKIGDRVYFSGKPKADKLGVQMINPNYEKETVQKARGEKATTHTARIVPMYHLTSGISHKQLRYLVSQVIKFATEITEWIPDEIMEKADLVTLAEAVRGIHFPQDNTDLEQALRRLKFGELYILQLRAEMIRQSIKRSQASEIKFKQTEIKALVDSLPFQLTKAQKVVAWEILQDLERSEPMNRLLEGDVGSGKTVVAAMAMYSASLNNYQTVIMVPTEILAKQHFEELSGLLGNKNEIGLLTRTQIAVNNGNLAENSKIGQKRELLTKINSGELKIVVGTHALLSEKVDFKNLGLVIVDEQHRFGVEQRKIIREKSGNQKTMPHFLSMTATPIPRSFALTLYGDLDLSIINEMPLGRKPIKTLLVEAMNRDKAYKFIREQVKSGQQVFVICPLIESTVIPRVSEESLVHGLRDPLTSSSAHFIRSESAQDDKNVEKKSVMSEYEKLSKQIFPDLRVGYLHGKMKSKEKEETMDKFRKGETNILVSTSVIEVGVDIPNASVMMIEGAERFGLAQLHQFRGRVGRAEHQSYCLLFSHTQNEKTLERLKFFEANNDGFKVAEYDLETRGPGEVYGTTQSGLVDNLRLATLRDTELIKFAQQFSRGVDFEKYPVYKEKVGEWKRGTHLE